MYPMERKEQGSARAVTNYEELFLLTFEQAAVGIAHTAPSGAWLRVNQRLCDIVGYRRAELLQLSFQDITHPDDLHTDEALVQKLLRRELTSYTLEKRYLRKDGGAVWVKIHVSLACDIAGAPHFFVVVIEDIQACKEAEESARKGQVQLRLLIEQAPMSIAMFDRDMKHLAVSRRWTEEYGCGRELIGRNLYDVFPDLPEHWREIHRAALTGEFSRNEEDSWVRDGRRQWLRWAVQPWTDQWGAIGGVVIAFDDITERKRNEERFRLAMVASNDGLWDWDVVTGQVYYSVRWKAMLGYEEYELPSNLTTFKSLIHPDDFAPTFKAINELLAGPDDTRSFELRMRHKLGHDLVILSRVLLIRDAAGRPVRLIGTHLDTTELKRVETALRESRSQLQAIFDNLETGIITATLDGRMLYWNRAALTLHGYDSFEDCPSLTSDFDAMFELSALSGERVPYEQWPLVRVLRGEELPAVEYVVRRIDVRRENIHRFRGCLVRGHDGAPLLALLTVTDVTAQRHAEQRLERAAAVFSSTQEGIAITDTDGNVLAINPAFTVITEYTEAEVLGKNMRILQSGRHDRAFFLQMWYSITSTGAWQGEIWNRRKSGEIYPQWLAVSTVLDERTQRPGSYVAVFIDMSRMSHVETHMEHLAHHDPLTDLPNRLLLTSRLNHYLERTRRKGGQGAVLFIDLDRFKPVNDDLGHAAGDELLQAVAQRLHKRLRDVDTLARWGGDEFVIVLDDVSDRDVIERLATGLIEQLGLPFTVANGREVTIGASIGVSLFPTDGIDVETLVHQADKALYQAKSSGGGVIRYYGRH